MAFTPPARRRIVLLRHGSVTYFDEQGRPQGSDFVPLNDNGRAQASAAGRALSGLRFDKMIVSGLPRTVQTLECVQRESEHFEMRQKAYEVWPEWVEIRSGKLADIAPQDAERAMLGALNEGIPDPKVSYQGGETIAAFGARVRGGVARLLADPSWDQVLLVLHGGVNRVFLSHALTAGTAQQETFFAGFQQAPACINVIDVRREVRRNEPHAWVLRTVNYNPTDVLHQRTRATTVEEGFTLYSRYLDANSANLANAAPQ